MALVDTILPYLRRQKRTQKTGSMTDEVTAGQREESAPTICIPILSHFLRLHDYGCKHEYILLHAINCVSQVSQKTLSASTLPSLSAGGGSYTVTLFPGLVFDRQETAPRGRKQFVPGLSLPHAHTHGLSHKHTPLLNTALLSGIFASITLLSVVTSDVWLANRNIDFQGNLLYAWSISLQKEAMYET